MSLILPTDAKFSIGTSTANAVSKVDMSLDDIMKSRREQSNANRRTSRRKTDPKKPSATTKDALLNSNKRRQGARRASKEANINAKRGIRSTKSATKMEIEKDIEKEFKNTARTKKKNVRFQNDRMKPTPRAKAPTKKAIKAAVTAMTGAGFKVPDGMKVVISVEKDENLTQGMKQNKNNRNTGKGGGGRGPNKSRR